jgi:hypothetical protein
MFIATITLVVILSVCALYAYETYNVRLRRDTEPTRSGADPEFAHMGETDWWERALTSTEFFRW